MLRYTDLFCKISKSGYGTNFQKFFMCYLYAKYLKQRLYLCDTTSNITESFHLILDTFQPVSNVVYTNKQGLTIFEDKITQLNKYLCTLTDTYICSEARTVFKLNAVTQEKVNTYLKSAAFPAFDIGIHIRMGDKITSGEMAAISLDTYRKAIQDAQILLKKDTLNIYVMTDNSPILSSLKEAANPSWSLYSLKPPIPSTGHDQKTFNAQPTKDKMESYYHFLSELHIMQRCPYIVCTYSSNIGRFLYMTREPGSIIQSLDIPIFTVLHDMDVFLKNKP